MEDAHEVAALEAKVRDLQERLDTLAGLEERLRVAEARASDAEQRLQALTDQAAPGENAYTESPVQENDLRARLARTASMKKPGRREPR